MKRKIVFWAILAVCAVFVGSAFAETIGPLSSKDGLTLGVGYATNSRVIQGKTFASVQEYVGVEYVSKGWQPYLRLGYTDLKIKNGFGGTWGDFKDSGGVFGTVGLKKSLYKKDKWTIGAYGQVSLSQDFSDQESGVDYGVPLTIELKVKNYTEAKIGALIQRAIGPVEAYVGPFYQWAGGTIEGVGTTPTETNKRSLSIKADDDFGGLAGAVINLGKNFGLNVEVQQTSKTSIATALTYRF